MPHQDSILFDGSPASADRIAAAVAPLKVEMDAANGRPRLCILNGSVAAYVYPGEHVAVPFIQS